MARREAFVTLITEQRKTDVENQSLQRQIRWVGDKAYLWVKNKTGGTLTVGQIVYYGMTTDTSFLEAYKLGQSTVGTDPALMAGVCAGSIADGSYGWIQIYGRNDDALVVATSTLAVAVGHVLQGATGTFNASSAAPSVASGTAPLHVRNLLALQAVATTVTVAAATKVFIRCLQ